MLPTLPVRKDSLRYTRPLGQKAVGIAVYVLLGVFVVPIAGVFAGGLVFWLSTLLSIPESISERLGWAGGALAAGFALRYVFRDYRRRASVQIDIFQNRVEAKQGDAGQTLHFAEVRDVRCSSKGIELISETGKRFLLPVDFVRFDETWAFLETNLFPSLSRSLEQRLHSTGTICIREPAFQAIARLAWGLLLFAVGPILVLRFHSIFSLAHSHTRRGWRGRSGGLTLSQKGVQERETGLFLDWSQWQIAAIDQDGIVLSNTKGGQAATSPKASEFWAVAYFLRGKLLPAAQAG